MTSTWEHFRDRWDAFNSWEMEALRKLAAIKAAEAGLRGFLEKEPLRLLV